MTLKPTQFRFQVAATNSVSVQANIVMDGVPLWAGTLAHTQSSVDIGPWTNDETPYSSAACEINTPEVVTNPQKLTKIFTISVTGGDIVLVGINQTNNPMFLNNVYAGGNPDFSDMWDVDTQPLWNGQAILSRYTIDDNLGITGPGSILIKSGETCEFTAELWQYCPVIT
jgi:hypothetical protein